MAAHGEAVSESGFNVWKALSIRRRIGLVLLLIFSALSLWICLRIEWLNRKAGFKLPRNTSHYPEGASRAWRAVSTRPEWVRKSMGQTYQLNELMRQLETNASFGLNRDEINIPPEVWEDIDRRLPEVVRSNQIDMSLFGMTSLGILQYPLGMMLVACGCLSFRGKISVVELWICRGALMVGVIGILRAWQLSYFSSVMD